MFSRKIQPAASASPPTPATEETEMRKPLLLLPAAVLAVAVAYNLPSVSQEGGKSAKADPQGRVKQIYNIDCALCHGANGDGKTDLAKDMQLNLSDFTDPKTLEGKTDDQLFDLIRKGKDKMPGEEPTRAKNDEVKALIQYIRHMSKDQPAAPAAAPAPAAAAPTAPGAN
jgi:mono/diheme cytochrome c family protein